MGMTGIWRQFCVLMVKIFYRRYEVSGLEHLNTDGPVLLCSNHANALADAIVLQAISSRLIHPLARSGLFKNPLLWPVLKLIHAVPIYRRQDKRADTVKNRDSFERCYALFDQQEILLIFPEGQSHSDPSLRPLKSGAARMVLGANDAGREIPRVVPVGLNFSDKGHFRSTVLIKVGEPIALDVFLNSEKGNRIKGLTQAIYQGLDDVTLNLDSHEELNFIKSLERFFAFRHGKYRQRSLELKFRAFKKLAQAEKRLNQLYPDKMASIKRQLHNFERLCQYWDIRDYHLTFEYKPAQVATFVIRSLGILFLVLPLGLWGIINAYLPFILTRSLAMRLATGPDQYDTAKMAIGLFLFSLFWWLQVSWAVAVLPDTQALLYALSLLPAAAAAIVLRNEWPRILENIRVFFLFARKRKLRRYLETRRKRLEQELAYLLRIIKQPSLRD